MPTFTMPSPVKSLLHRLDLFRNAGAGGLEQQDQAVPVPPPVDAPAPIPVEPTVVVPQHATVERLCAEGFRQSKGYMKQRVDCVATLRPDGRYQVDEQISFPEKPMLKPMVSSTRVLTGIETITWLKIFEQRMDYTVGYERAGGADGYQLYSSLSWRPSLRPVDLDEDPPEPDDSAAPQM